MPTVKHAHTTHTTPHTHTFDDREEQPYFTPKPTYDLNASFLFRGIAEIKRDFPNQGLKMSNNLQQFLVLYLWNRVKPLVLTTYRLAYLCCQCGASLDAKLALFWK